MLEDIIKNNLNKLFQLYTIEAYADFRLTRDSDLDIDEEAEDLMVAIEKSIKKRQRGEPVRVEIAQKCDQALREFLVDMLKVNESEIYEIPGPLDLTFLSKFGSIKGCDDLRFEPIKPVTPPADFYGYDDVFEAIRERIDLYTTHLKALIRLFVLFRLPQRTKMFLLSSKHFIVSAEILRLLPP